MASVNTRIGYGGSQFKERVNRQLKNRI